MELNFGSDFLGLTEVLFSWISFKELEWFGSEFQNSLKKKQKVSKSLKKFSKKITEKAGQKFTEKNH